MSAKRITTAAATALAAGVGVLTPATAYAAPTPVPTPKTTPATFPGQSGSLTVSIGDNVLHFAGGSTSAPMPSAKVNDAEWAPDGSRVAYIDENGNLVTVRADSTDLIVVASGLGPGVHPTWMNGGSFLVYAQGGQLYKVPSLGGAEPVVISAGHNPGDVDASPQGGPNGSLVFQRTTAGVTRVWIYNGYTGNALNLDLGGTSPSISPDGTKVAYIAPDVHVRPQVWIAQSDGSNVTQITFDNFVTQNNNTPVWSPDGSQVAFSASGSVATVPPVPHGAENVVAELTGRISWQTLANNLVERLDGPDRIGTAVEASQWNWANNGAASGTRKQANTVVIAREDIFADALAGSALAAREHAPLLLTPTTSLDDRTLAEMRRILPPNATVYILGGLQALSQHTEDQIKAAGYYVNRIGGIDRFQTAVDIAETMVPTYTTSPVTILTATGMNFPDALAAGAVAGSRPNTIVLLTADGVMPTNSLNFFNSVPHKTVYGIGGSGVNALISVHIPATPVSGGDRFITAAMVATTFFGGPQVVGIATGYKFPDALAGGAMVGSVGGPLLLTGPTLIPTETATYLRHASGSISDAVMFGGPAVLDDNLKAQVGELISLPGRWSYVDNTPGAHVGPLIVSAN